MHPLHTNLPVIHLKPGELYLGEQPTMVTTTLGSCVSLIFFNQPQRLGAICHALLPSDDHQENSFRFVDRAFFWMLEQFQSRNIASKQIQVKLFGGADVLECFQGNCRTVTVGQQNIHQALELFKAHGLQVQASNVGGALGRKVFFFTHTGEVLLKRVKKVCWLDLNQ
ncbi:MAG: chemotaxis protein CheD [Deltaproteobacteria bacterium]|nr:chemotaxis protein CheD [Deltaproteobacteria bacterium]